MAINLGVGVGVGHDLTKGGGWSPAKLDAYMAALSDGMYFDFSKTDRHFQENIGPTLAGAIGDPIGLAMDSRLWSGQTLAQVVGAQTEMIANGDFASSSGWTAINGWTIGSGVAVHAGGGGNGTLSRVVTPTQGRTYRISGTISGRTAGSLTPNIGGTSGQFIVSNGAFTQYIVAGAGNTVAFLTDSPFDGTLDDVSCKLVPGNHGVQSTGTLKGIRQANGNKFDGSDDNNLTPLLALSGANFIVAAVSIPATLASAQVIAGASGAGANRCFLAIDTSGRVCGGVGSDSTGTIVGTSDLRGLDVVVGISFDGTSVSLFANLSQEYGASQNSTPTTTIPFRIGANNNNGTAGSFFAGTIRKVLVGRDALTIDKFRQIRSALVA